jgi:hypothetical protein
LFGGSHSVFSEDYYTPLDDSAIQRYLEVFKQIFVKMNHITHYNMMMGISPEIGRETHEENNKRCLTRTPASTAF